MPSASGRSLRRINPSANQGGGVVKDHSVMIFLMVFVTILLLILFFGVTIAGGRAHTRANEETAKIGGAASGRYGRGN